GEGDRQLARLGEGVDHGAQTELQATVAVLGRHLLRDHPIFEFQRRFLFGEPQELVQGQPALHDRHVAPSPDRWDRLYRRWAAEGRRQRGRPGSPWRTLMGTAAT